MYFGKEDGTIEVTQYYSSFVKQILKYRKSDRSAFTEIPTFIIFRNFQWGNTILVFLYCKHFAEVDFVKPQNNFKSAPVP